MKKTLSIRDEQGLKLYGFVLANFFYPPKGKFLYPFLPPFPFPKTERKKDQKKEKRTKISTENFKTIRKKEIR